MEEIRRIAANPRMSGAVVHRGIAYLSGQVAIDHRGGAVGDQVREVLDRIDALLAEAGSDRSRLLTASIFLSDLAILSELNAVWDGWIAPGCAPTRTTMQVTLASPLYALEIAVTAAAD
ncbi:RidA family protein [Sphingomonas jatrophae]|uniref:Enamine deaminase RidA, house cleaning of reactive enamine intermediates, YjgF/YER057c/UK114 family n=1 Tax=Sphingomonas jatrophae TaxID=1166337 RepID=A0A1I6M4Z9_9SPHN|nr:RidA family protein [Sphingomonas jatrophae]SFS10612.1 Enamine deaminase RidA, house cleaning of reactive enamine intermediates, YjgF/YER057c/UK114 family [Sphingomonas jatrophae]